MSSRIDLIASAHPPLALRLANPFGTVTALACHFHLFASASAAMASYTILVTRTPSTINRA